MRWPCHVVCYGSRCLTLFGIESALMQFASNISKCRLYRAIKSSRLICCQGLENRFGEAPPEPGLPGLPRLPRHPKNQTSGAVIRQAERRRRPKHVG
jgi:hypothetical protein